MNRHFSLEISPGMRAIPEVQVAPEIQIAPEIPIVPEIPTVAVQHNRVQKRKEANYERKK